MPEENKRLYDGLINEIKKEIETETFLNSTKGTNLIKKIYHQDDDVFEGFNEIKQILCKCPVCGSENVSDDSLYNNNGVIGYGYSQWKVKDRRVCNDCGVVFKPVKLNES